MPPTRRQISVPEDVEAVLARQANASAYLAALVRADVATRAPLRLSAADLERVAVRVAELLAEPDPDAATREHLATCDDPGCCD